MSYSDSVRSMPEFAAWENWRVMASLAMWLSLSANPFFMSPTMPPPVRLSIAASIIASAYWNPSTSDARLLSIWRCFSPLGAMSGLEVPVVPTALTAANSSPMSSVTSRMSQSTSNAREHPGNPLLISPPAICPREETVAILVTGSSISSTAFFIPSSAACGKSWMVSGFLSATAPRHLEHEARTVESSVERSSAVIGTSTFVPPMIPRAWTAERRSCISSMVSMPIRRSMISSSMPSSIALSANASYPIRRIVGRSSLSIRK
mmetsp:Transcript_59604/g.141738  ORF Transcript_59604/g.141738 Transcript_59604/m.141738 type:complete len:263 (-) Transcript_59604:217-1005(-)